MDKKETFKVGDTVYVEQAWEDQAGHLHDEYAVITSIRNGGLSAKLKFKNQKVNAFFYGYYHPLEELELA